MNKTQTKTAIEGKGTQTLNQVYTNNHLITFQVMVGKH